MWRLSIAVEDIDAMVAREEAKKTSEDDGRMFAVEELQALPGWKD